jgi:hypothetical protein
MNRERSRYDQAKEGLNWDETIFRVAVWHRNLE